LLCVCVVLCILFYFFAFFRQLQIPLVLSEIDKNETVIEISKLITKTLSVQKKKIKDLNLDYTSSGLYSG